MIKLQIADASFHSNGLNLSKLSIVLPYNDCLHTLKWFLVIFRTKLSYTCSSNLNYFREIGCNSFKWAKVATKLGNSRYVGIGHPIWSTLCENSWGAILHHMFCTCFTKEKKNRMKRKEKEKSYYRRFLKITAGSILSSVSREIPTTGGSWG